MNTPEEHHEIIAAANDAGIVARIEGDLALRLMDDPELAQQKAIRAARAAFRAAFLRGRLAAWGIVPTCPACGARPMICGGGDTNVGAWASLACDCPRRYWSATKYGVLPWVYDYESGPAYHAPDDPGRYFDMPDPDDDAADVARRIAAAQAEPVPCPCGVECPCECEGDPDACECPDNPESPAYGCADCARSYGPGRPCRCEDGR